MISADLVQPKRIAMIAPSLAGVLRDRANLIRALKARGHTILVVAASHLSGEVAALHHLGAEHRNFDPKPPGLAFFAKLRVRRDLRDILASWPADAAVVSGSELASIAAAAARKARVARIVSIFAADAGNASEGERGTQLQSYRRALKLSDAVICHNEEDANSVRIHLNTARQALVTTPGDGVDLVAFSAMPLPAVGPLTFLMIANPDARLAIEAFTSAAATVAANTSDVRFEIATDREAAQDTTLFTVEGVTFHGRAADPAKLLAGAHVAVHLSADDGSPTALKQALAVGRPVVTLNVPGCREMVDERVNGCLVPVGSEAHLVAALQSFLTYRDLMPAEARAARVKAERCFGSDVVLGPVVAAIEG